MKPSPIFRLRYLSLLPLCLAVSAQVISANQPAAQGPVSYSSVNQLNLLLSQLEHASQAAQVDLAKLRIEKWKTDSDNKRQAQGNVESIQRNLQSALPELIAELKASPENLTSTFKIYRNLDALYDVFESVAESAGAFGSKDEFQSLETLAGAKELEVTRLRAALQEAQASVASQPPKKIVVDDTAPAKKPAKKKPVPKANPTTPSPGTASPVAAPPPPK